MKCCTDLDNAVACTAMDCCEYSNSVKSSTLEISNQINIETLIQKNKDLLNERDVAVSERNVVANERDVAVSERDAAVSERAVVTNELDQCQQSFDVLNHKKLDTTPINAVNEMIDVSAARSSTAAHEIVVVDIGLQKKQQNSKKKAHRQFPSPYVSFQEIMPSSKRPHGRRLAACDLKLADQLSATGGFNVLSANCTMGSNFYVYSGETLKIKKDPLMIGELIIDRQATSASKGRHFVVDGTLLVEGVTLTGGYEAVSRQKLLQLVVFIFPMIEFLSLWALRSFIVSIGL